MSDEKILAWVPAHAIVFRHDDGDLCIDGDVSPAEPRTVWVLVMEAVYDHGIYGVFEEEDEAVAYANLLIDESDYHHTIRVEEWEIGGMRPADSRLTGRRGRSPQYRRPGRPRPTVKVIRIEPDESEGSHEG